MGAETVLAVTSMTQELNSISDGYFKSNAIKMQSQFEANQFAREAEYSEMKAKNAIMIGKKESLAERMKAKKLIGMQRARMASKGIDIDSGSALDIQTETAEFGAMDSLTIKNNAFREALGYRIESIDQDTQGKFTRNTGKYKARRSLMAGGMGAVSEYGKYTETIKSLKG